MDYQLFDPEGEVIDSSDDGQFAFLFGVGQIIPGLEKALNGKGKGDSFDVTINPDEAYGERDEQKVQAVPRSHITGIDEITVGMQLQSQDPEGEMMIVTVVDVSDEEVTLDGNHPLAGVILKFSVTIKDIRAATEEEKSHGHVHSGDCHH